MAPKTIKRNGAGAPLGSHEPHETKNALQTKYGTNISKSPLSHKEELIYTIYSFLLLL